MAYVATLQEQLEEQETRRVSEAAAAEALSNQLQQELRDSLNGLVSAKIALADKKEANQTHIDALERAHADIQRLQAEIRLLESSNRGVETTMTHESDVPREVESAAELAADVDGEHMTPVNQEISQLTQELHDTQVCSRSIARSGGCVILRMPFLLLGCVSKVEVCYALRFLLRHLVCMLHAQVGCYAKLQVMPTFA